jgi:hypothetical protein
MPFTIRFVQILTPSSIGFSRLSLNGSLAFPVAQNSSSFGEPDISTIREKFSDLILTRSNELEEVSGWLSFSPVLFACIAYSYSRTTRSNSQQGIRVNNVKKVADDEDTIMFKEWESLVAERDALLSPAIDSGLPGAETTAQIPAGYEPAITTVYTGSMEGSTPVKKKPIAAMLPLHIVKQTVDEWPGEVTCQVSWDIAAHNSPHLNKVTDPRYLVYLQLQVECQLSNATSFTLKKYVACQVHKRSHKFRDTGRKSFFFANTPSIPRGTGVIYRVFTSVPTFDALDDSAAENQTETASNHFSEIASALKNLVEIDRLKQNMDMVSAKPTKATQLSDLKKVRLWFDPTYLLRFGPHLHPFRSCVTLANTFTALLFVGAGPNSVFMPLTINGRATSGFNCHRNSPRVQAQSCLVAWESSGSNPNRNNS